MGHNQPQLSANEPGKFTNKKHPPSFLSHWTEQQRSQFPNQLSCQAGSGPWTKSSSILTPKDMQDAPFNQPLLNHGCQGIKNPFEPHESRAAHRIMDCPMSVSRQATRTEAGILQADAAAGRWLSHTLFRQKTRCTHHSRGEGF